MAHTHPVVDSDSRFVINSTTREISTTSDKLELIQGDHQSERITFEIPKIVEGHDMSLSDRIEVHYINIERRTNATSRDVYIIDDAAVDGDKLTFSWLISGNATKYYGRLNFIILFECLDPDGNYTYKWNTEICKLLTIGEGISNTSAVIEDHSDILEKFKKEILEEAGEKSIQPDWNQNDETAKDYVKNRPFYTGDPVETVLVEESTVSFSGGNGLYMAEFPSTFSATVGETYKVSWDGTTYESTCVISDEGLVIGNLSFLDIGSDTGEPFLFLVVNGRGIMIGTTDTSASHTFSISGSSVEVVKINEKYLPDNLAIKSDVEVAKATAETAQTTAENAQTTAENAQTTADSNKEMISNMFTSVIAFTFDKQTSGRDTFKYNSFNYYKISDFTPAREDVTSFKGTRENGIEFSNITIGSNCVKYGLFIVVASAGYCSLPITETDTGVFNAPSAGLYALYEENNAVVTAGTGQFTLMSIDGLTIKSSTYGSTKKFRVTVDDDYNVSATNTSDSVSKALATTEYVDNSVSNPLNITSAAVGQIAKITAVDDTGKPTAWEAVDMPSGGGSVPKPLTYDYMPEGYPTKSVGTVTLMEEQEVAFALEDGATYYSAYLNEAFEIVEGQTYNVNWDGTDYECVCVNYRSSILAFGNLSIAFNRADNTGEPFLYIYTGTFTTHETAASHTISVKTAWEVITPMANEFLPVASEDKYGAVKKSEIVSAYNFPINAPHGQMVDAIAAFRNGNANIMWNGSNVISAHYNSSNDTISVVYADKPQKNFTYANVDGFYTQTLGSTTYGIEMILKSSTEGSTKNFRITVDDSGTLSATEVAQFNTVN